MGDRIRTCLRETRWTVTANVAGQACDRVRLAAQQALEARGVFHLVLAGGSTPRALYAQLAGLHTDWRGWHLWFGDERCLPEHDAQRNSRMADAAWLAASPIPPSQIHRMHAERGAVAGVRDYVGQLAGTETFDLVLLGLGEDGHTASLFPRRLPEPEDAVAIAVMDAPKPPAERISLSARRLSDARAVLFLVTGAGKCDAVSRWRRGDAIPAAEICPPHGTVEVLLEPVCLAEAQSQI